MTTPDLDHPPVLIVAGPTCSGKSALALCLAERLGGTVINSDSMQVYHELRILTARPTPADEARVPHRLYGVRPAAEPGSVAWWRAAALDEIAVARRPILCGGTGLYLAALAQGLADIPEPAVEAREEARHLLDRDGAAALHARLAAADPDTAAGLRPSDGQRLARAWEVWRSTGRGLSAWQRDALAPPPLRFRMILLDPPRPDLRRAIGVRFKDMLRAGGLAEAERMLGLGLSPELPAMRAHGVPELLGYLRGAWGLDEAERRATLATGQYTKRQATWFRHRPPVPSWNTHMIHARFAGLEQFSESWMADIESFIIGQG